MHLPILLLLLPLTLAFHTPRPSRPSPFPFRFNTTLNTNLTLPLPTGSPPRLPWSPNPARGRSGRGRRPGGRVFPALNTTLTTSTPPTMVPPVSLQSYRVSTGAISCSSDTGIISKTPGFGAGDTSALVSFILPAQARGRMCQLFFYLPSSLEGGNGTAGGNMTMGESEVSGSAQIDIFTTSAPAPYTCPIASWPPGNQRDQHLGRMQVVSTPGGRTWGVWEEKASGFLTRPTECETFGAGRRGFEIVGVGEEVLVSWTGEGGLVVGYW